MADTTVNVPLEEFKKLEEFKNAYIEDQVLVNWDYYEFISKDRATQVLTNEINRLNSSLKINQLRENTEKLESIQSKWWFKLFTAIGL